MASSSDQVTWTTAPKASLLGDRTDTPLVALAAAAAVLLVLGQVVANLAGRDAVTGWRLAADAATAIVPTALAVALLRRPAVPRLRAATLLTAGVALAAAFAAADTRASAAAFAVPACLVLTACRPRWRLSRGVAWRRVGGAVLGVGVLAGLLVSPGGGRHSTGIQLADGRLKDGQDAIDTADTRFLKDTLGATQRTPGARCYFVRQLQSADFEDVVACGPVAHPPDPTEADTTETTETTEPPALPTATEPGAWDLYPASVDHGDLHLADPDIGRAVDPTLLHRPDDLRPPDADDDSGVSATVSPGFATMLFDEPENTRPGDGYVFAGTGRVTIGQVAAPDTIVDDGQVERKAPEGYRLVAADLSFDDDVEGITLEVLSGPDRIDITPAVSRTGDLYIDGWVVAVARDDGVDPLLEVTYRGRSQRLSLTTGERVSGEPLLYEPLAQELDKAVPAATVPITVPVPSPHTGDVDIRGYTIVRADLVAFETNLGWAPPGQAWMAVTIDQLDQPSFFDIDAFRIEEIFRFDPHSSFALQPAGADDWIGPAGAWPTDDVELVVVFLVSDLTRTATFRTTPTWRLIFDDKVVAVKAPTVDTPLAVS